MPKIDHLDDRPSGATPHHRLDQYRAERAQAQSRSIDASLTRRRFGADREHCDGRYEVLER